jgi:hypothetical protein
MLKFVVVGTGRCGTAYIAQVLTRMGIPCGHEWVYSAHPRRYPDLDIVGDSSAQAVPFLHEFTGLVLHQVRDPLRVIGSFLGFGLFKDPVAHGIDGQFTMRHFQFTGDELGDAIRYYVEWNERCERVEQSRYLRYQLEQIDVGLSRHICQFLREDVSESVIQEALQSVPRNFNTRFNSQSLTWDHLPDGRDKERLRELARRYGYLEGAEPNDHDGAHWRIDPAASEPRNPPSIARTPSAGGAGRKASTTRTSIISRRLIPRLRLEDEQIDDIAKHLIEGVRKAARDRSAA